MKSLFNILFCSLFLLSTASISIAADKTAPCSVYIVLDQSWSTEQSNDGLCSLAGQVITSLSAGDYLEIISISSSKPQIRLAQSIKTGSPDEAKQISQVFTKIKSKFLNDAKLSRAVEFSLNRIQRSGAGKSKPAFIMVFSDGKRSDSDAGNMESLYPKLAAENISLFMTGTKQANRRFLIASNKGLMDFNLLSDANPAQWLKEKLKISADITNSHGISPAGTVKEKQPSDSGFEINARSETSIKFPSVQPPVKDSKPLETKFAEAKKEKVLPVPEQTAKTPLKKESVKAVEKPADKLSATKKQPSIMLRPFWGVLTALALLLALLLFNYRKARNWKSKTQKILKRTIKPSGTLLARYKEQVFHLGRIDQLRQIHIGSSAKNTIRIFDSSVDSQHIRIYRRFGTLMVKNLSSKTIYSNGIPIKSKLTSRLTLPCILKLSDSVTVRLELQKQVTLNSTEKEASNETQK